MMMLDLFWCLSLLNIVGVWWTYKEHEVAVAKCNKPGLALIVLLMLLSIIVLVAFGISSLCGLYFSVTIELALAEGALALLSLCYFAMLVIVESSASYFVFLFFAVLNMNISHIALTLMRS
jgi:hypothetical protein